MSLLHVDSLNVDIGGRAVLTNVSVTVAPGETVGLVGESGSGKSMTAFAAVGMLPPAAKVTGGRIETCGVDVFSADMATLRRLRGQGASLIFQDPMQALMPIRRVGSQLEDVLRTHRKIGGPQAQTLGMELFAAMGIVDPERVWQSRPFELSGGQRQRALIAISLAAEPQLLLADEVTTALDADARQDVLKLFAAHVRGSGCGALIISHDLGLVRASCDRVYVMHRGQVVESGFAADVIDAPKHPYTQMLLASLPERSPRKALLPVQKM